MNATTPAISPDDVLREHLGKEPFLLRSDGHHLSYASLLVEVLERRQQLSDWGIAAGHRVGLQIDNPEPFILWFLALLASGSVVVPVNPDSPATDIQRTLSRAGATFLYDGGVGPRLLSDPWPKPSVTEGGLILLTSGSTGEPKPVGLPWRSLWHAALGVAQAHRLTRDDRGFSPLPLFHINALVVGVLATLSQGASVMIPDRFHASHFWEAVESSEVTWVNAVPTIIGVLAAREARPRHPEKIRFMRSASAPLPASLRRRAEALFHIPIVETYGMTEAGSQITANPLPEEGRRPGSVGLPWGIQVRVVNRQGVSLPSGVRGLVEIRGPSVLDPSWGPNAWAWPSFHDGWYRTGDLGRLDEDGYLYLVGRSRDVINRGGEKIFPREVEEWLLASPDVAEAVVLGRPHPVLGEEPVAYVAPLPGKQLSEDRLRSWAERGLARFKRPSDFIILPELPRGSTGKILKHVLRRARPPH